MAFRSDSELREQSIHVLWEFRQLMRLATHVYNRQHEGVTQMVDPLDAAALESFCLHARALVEFLWRERDDLRNKNDAVAGDWFDAGTWDEPSDLPPELTDLGRRAGFALAHISYKRISPNEAWGWDLVGIAHAQPAADVVEGTIGGERRRRQDQGLHPIEQDFAKDVGDVDR